MYFACTVFRWAVLILLGISAIVQTSAATSSLFEPRRALSSRAIVQGTLCASVPVHIQISVIGVGLVDETLIGSLCLCTEAGVLTKQSVADLGVALKGNLVNKVVLNTVMTSLGLTTTDQLVTRLIPIIQGDLGKKQATCDYPDNSTPVCGTGCSYVCHDDYKQCGGFCIAISRSCISNIPQKKRSQIPHCPSGWKACKVRGRHAYECLNVQSDVESCGACLYDPSIDGNSTTQSTGTDCTLLLGTNDVSCQSGACRVHSCMRGWELNGGVCVQKKANIRFHLQS